MSYTNELLAKLPQQILPFKDEILATVKPVIEIKLSSSDDLPLWASKVGGTPYLPEPVMYPQDKNGDSLLFLAQINCEELPENDLLPNTGMLSFFIGGDSLYGLDFKNSIEQNEFTVFYFDSVLKDKNLLWTDFSSIQQICDEKDLYSPIEKNESYQMNFELKEKEISFEDFNFQRDFFDNTEFRKSYLNLTQKGLLADNNLFQSFSHHLLGYPYFVQDDPRDDEKFANYILLFQLMSEYNVSPRPYPY